MKPTIVLHAPRKIGSDWVLEAEIRPAGIRLAAFVSPESLAWVERQIRKGAGWVQRLLGKAKLALGGHVALAGEWKRFGVLGELATSVAYEIAGSPETALQSFLLDGAKLYLSARGERGPLAQENAGIYVERIFADAAVGDPKAIEAQSGLALLSLADECAHRPDAYALLGQLEAENSSDSMKLLAAIRALGTASFNAPDVVVSYDAETFLGEPESAKAMFGYVWSERALRALPTTMSPIELSRVLSNLLRQAGVA